MSLVLHTSEGDLPVHLFFKECPTASFNFLALCAASYFSGCRFLRYYPGVLLQTGDPTNSAKGGESVFMRMPALKDGEEDVSVGQWGALRGERFFHDEGFGTTEHSRRGVISMAHQGSKADSNASQFLLFLSPQPAFDGRYTVFGEVDSNSFYDPNTNPLLIQSSSTAANESGIRTGEEVLAALEIACGDVDHKNRVLGNAQIRGATVLYNPFVTAA